MEVEKWTGDESVKISEVINILNEILRLDSELTNKIIYDRLPCNHSIRDHKTIQVHCCGDSSRENPKVGLLGILNGLFGIDKNHYGGISAEIYTESRKVNFFRLTDTDEISRLLKKK